MAKAKAQLLCLHSSGGSAEILRRQLTFARLNTALEEVASLTFLEGTLTMDPEVPEAKMLQKFFKGCENRMYMRLVAVDADGNDTPVALDTAGQGGGTNALGGQQYRGVQEALEPLARAIAQAHAAGAAVDGVFAFSQGANLMSILIALVEAATDEAAEARRRLCRPSFAVFVCFSDFGWSEQLMDASFCGGALAAIDRGLAAVPSVWSAPVEAERPLPGVWAAPLRVPALIILGETDPIMPLGRALAARYADAQVVAHPGGHKLPSGAAYAQQIATFVRTHRQQPTKPGLENLLVTADLARLAEPMSAASLAELTTLLGQGRPTLLARLAELGLALPDRQKLAGVLQKALREGVV